MMREWRAWHAGQLELALDADSSTIVKSIMALVRGLVPKRMPALLRLMRSVDWRLVDADTKFTILHELNSAIAELREKEGKPPWDDALPGEPDTLFQISKEMLFK
jgi:hypothetical protein